MSDKASGHDIQYLLVLQKMTAWVMVKVSYKSQRVSNFHSCLRENVKY